MEFLWSPWRHQYVASEQKPPGCVLCLLAQRQGTEALQTDFDQAHYVLFRGQQNFVVLNLFPYTSAHLMIVPYLHTADFATIEKATSDEMMDLAKRAQKALSLEYRPDGYNLGMNLGHAAGAGIAEHLHVHVLPRWQGDTNFMTTVGETRVLPEALAITYQKLKKHFL